MRPDDTGTDFDEDLSTRWRPSSQDAAEKVSGGSIGRYFGLLCIVHAVDTGGMVIPDRTSQVPERDEGLGIMTKSCRHDTWNRRLDYYVSRLVIVE